MTSSTTSPTRVTGALPDGSREASALLAHRRPADPGGDQHARAAAVHQGHGPRRTALRRTDRHPAQQRTAHAGRAGHDDRDRHPRHRPLGGCGDGGIGRRCADDHPRLGEPRQPRHRGVRGRCRAPRGARARVVERHAHRGAGDPAHHRHARAHAGRPWCGPPDHRGLHHHGQQWALRVHRNGVPADSSLRVPHLLDGNPRDRRVRTQDGARHAHRGGWHQPGGEPPGRCPVARDHLQRVRRQRPDGRHRRHHLQLEHQGRRRQRRRALHRAVRHPRRRAGRHVTAGGQVQHRRHGDRRPDHPDAELDHPVPRRPLGAEPGVLRVGGGARGHRPVAACSPARTMASWRDRIRWHGRQACEGGGWGMTTTQTTESTRSSPKQADDRFINRHASLMPTFAALGVRVLLIFAQLYFGYFVSPGNMSALLLDNAYLMVIAVGMTFVILTAGIDLSVGSVMAFTGILLASLLGRGMPAAVAVPVILLAGAVIGLLIGILVQYFDVQPFIASLAGLFLARGLAFVVSLKSIRVDDPSVLWLQSTRFQVGDWYITPTGIIALLAVGVGAFVLQYTRFGRTVYAIGGNEQSARLMGLKVARTKVFVYLISGSLAGLAGLILTAYSGAGYPRNGIGTELDAIAAVVIGGTLLSGGRGYVLGSMIGVLVYGTIKTVISFLGAEQAWMQIIVGGLLLLFILIQRFSVARSERRE